MHREHRVRPAGQFVLDSAAGPVDVHCSTGPASSDDAVDPAALPGLSDAQMYGDTAAAHR